MLQVALSFTLLIGAGLLLKSFYKLLHVDPGIRPDNVLTFEYRLPRNKYNTNEAQWNFHRQVVERISRVPGVEAAALARGVSFTGNGGSVSIVLPDRARPQRGQEPRVLLNTVTAGYFTALGIPFVRGRLFNEADRLGASPVYLINQTMAARFWPHEDPLGKTIQHAEDTPPGTIIGIVGDTKHLWLSDPPQPQLYISYSQFPGTFATVAARTSVEPLSLSHAVRQAFRQVDGDQPMWKLRTMNFLLTRSLSDQRFMLMLMLGLAGLALLLATVGLYGVMAYGVAQRTAEIGLRLALGATSLDVLWMVLRQGMTLVLPGLALGILAAQWGTQLLQRLLFEVSPTDQPMFAWVASVLLAAALVACWLPARRATKVDPLIALRHE